MAESEFIVEVTEENFVDMVLEASARVLVVVDFWADWCAPCRSLMPVLASLAEEYNGQFVLAKINSDEQQALAAEFGVRSLPTVKLVKQGQVVDEFMGALPEGQVREFIDRHIERESDRLVATARELSQTGKADESLTVLQQAYEMDPFHIPVVQAFATALIDQDRLDDARAILEALPADARGDDEIRQLFSQLHFAGMSQSGENLVELEQRVSGAPGDCASREKLANLYMAQGQYEAGLQQFLEIMKHDRQYGDDAGRKGLLQAFEMLGSDPLVSRYRRMMSNLMLR